MKLYMYVALEYSIGPWSSGTLRTHTRAGTKYGIPGPGDS